MGWIDTHCHLNDDNYANDIDEVLKMAFDADVDHMIVIGYDFFSSQQAVVLADRYDQLSAAVGYHPSHSDKFDVYSIEKLSKLCVSNNVVAIGEIGLDDYWKENPSKEVQVEVFRQQLKLAQELDKPVVIHMRNATKDTYEILKQFPSVRGVLHCYSGSYEMAKEFIKMGYYISLAGPVTFKNAVEPKEVATKIPLENLLIETDAPYLTPHPYRGKRNEPAMVSLIGKEIADLRKIPENELKNIVRINTNRLFQI